MKSRMLIAIAVTAAVVIGITVWASKRGAKPHETTFVIRSQGQAVGILTLWPTSKIEFKSAGSMQQTSRYAGVGSFVSSNHLRFRLVQSNTVSVEIKADEIEWRP